MPQLTKKRKAALLAWQTKKKQKVRSPDQVRSGTPAAVHRHSDDLPEIPQPEAGIEDCDLDSIDLEDLVVPRVDQLDEIAASIATCLDISAHSVAECRITDMDQFTVPYIPSLDDDLELLWQRDDEDYLLAESSFNGSSLSNGLTIDAFPPSLILSSPVPSPPPSPVPSPPPSPESSPVPLPIPLLAPSPMPLPVPTLAFSKAPSLAASPEPSPSCIDDDQSGSLKNDERAKKFGLTRSKTMIISIPGRPTGSPTMYCYCAACIKTAAVEQKAPAPESRSPKSFENNDAETSAKMVQIYAAFVDREVPINRSRPKVGRPRKIHKPGRAENLFCRLCKYNVGKRIDTMSRGSFTRRVHITALMCNESYAWHNTYMKMFTGEEPGFWTRKMFSEKAKLLERNRKCQKSPHFNRRSKHIVQDKETDYGEAAVEAAENAALDGSEIDTESILLKYQVSDATKLKLVNSMNITDMEDLAKGRILSKFIPEIINAREMTKWKKCDALLQNTNTYNYLKTNRAIVGLVLRVLKDEHALNFEEGQMFIDSCHEYLCCVPDAVSEDGSMLLLIRKKDSTGNIKEQASTTKGVLGCKFKNGEVSLDRNTQTEIQAALHICSSAKCFIFFMLGTNATDYLFKIIDKDESFFASKIEPKLKSFFDGYFLKKLIDKQISIKQ